MVFVDGEGGGVELESIRCSLGVGVLRRRIDGGDSGGNGSAIRCSGGAVVVDFCSFGGDGGDGVVVGVLAAILRRFGGGREGGNDSTAWRLVGGRVVDRRSSRCDGGGGGVGDGERLGFRGQNGGDALYRPRRVILSSILRRFVGRRLDGNAAADERRRFARS